MSDVGEAFAGMREESARKRASNRENARQILFTNRVVFDERNGGAHLIVKRDDAPFADFWPGTGLWITRDRDRRIRGRGIFQLLKTWKAHRLSGGSR